jgi:hypothetical protein
MSEIAAAWKGRAPSEAAATPASVPKDAPLVVPPILLEDDAPGLPSTPDLGHKFVLGPIAPAPSAAPSAPQLPESYGTGKFALTARDPHWLYAHWDFTREQQRQYNADSIHRHLVVRVHPESLAGHAANEIHVHPESQHWFIHVDRAGTKYTGELGYYKGTHDWVPVAEAASAATPPDAVSADKTIAFATIHPDAPIFSAPPEPIADTGLEASEWALEQIPTLAESFPMIEPSSGESFPVAPLLTGEERITPGSQPRVLDLLTASEEVGGISSARGGEQHGFWLNVNAEIVIYGGTEPSASVTLDGVPIKLRPDGTFTCHFALPDGNYELGLAAMSEQGDLRHATLKFSRRTEQARDVGAHETGQGLGEIGRKE